MVFISLEHHGKITLAKQICDYYKEQILSGRLEAGAKLPPSRTLAADLSVARNVVLEAYEQLRAEGYLQARQGAGLYVCEGITLSSHFKSGKTYTTETVDMSLQDTICFRTGIPDLSEIPKEKWASVYKECIRDLPAASLDYQTPEGNGELRSVLSNYLERARGVKATPDQIILTTGAAQAFSLLSKLIKKDEFVLTENPLSSGLYHTITGNGVGVIPGDVDEQGLVTSCLPERSPKMVFTSPSHQFPTGVVLPIRRRIELVQYAREHDAYIVEDDYDSEFRYEGNPIQCMQSLDPEHVIYVGTFSKTLMPALRIGYMVLPEQLVSKVSRLKYVEDYHSSELEQIVLAEFIKRGYYERHIARMKKLYLKKRNLLVQSLKLQFKDRVTILGEKAGLHLVADFSDSCFDEDQMQKIYRAGIEISNLEKHCITDEARKRWQSALLFGFGNVQMDQIEESIACIHHEMS